MISRVDETIIRFMRRIHLPLSRFAIFLVFFWFGILKVFEMSPASPLVISLLQRTVPYISPEMFLVGFGIYEVIIGASFLIPKMERVAIVLLTIHLVTTILPLFLLKSLTWQMAMVPTMEGQYIIKNILIIALAVGIAANLHSRRHQSRTL